MSETNRCVDKTLLIDYLYGEVEPAERDRVDTHLRDCAACAAEVSGLRDVRATLGEWAPPETELGFRLVAERESVPPAVTWRSRLRSTGAWGLAAAAMLVLAAAAAVANLEIEVGPEGLVVRTGWGERAPASAAPVSLPVGPEVGGADWVRSVESLIRESERRQQQMVDTRVRETEQRIADQRRTDLVEMERTFREVDAEDAELARQQLLEYMRRISSR